jgi:hypothetical protein
MRSLFSSETTGRPQPGWHTDSALPVAGREIVGPPSCGEGTAPETRMEPRCCTVDAHRLRSVFEIVSCLPRFTCKTPLYKVGPTRLELVASAMRRQRSGFLCVLTSRRIRVFKPNPKCFGESFFCCFHLSSNWVAARLLHQTKWDATSANRVQAKFAEFFFLGTSVHKPRCRS